MPEKKKSKKAKPKAKKAIKGGSVLKKSAKSGYIQVHMMYLMDELSWIKKNTKLPKTSGKSSATVEMVDHLLTWMGMRKLPWWNFWADEKEYKNWITLEEDHWLIDHNVRTKLLAKGLI